MSLPLRPALLKIAVACVIIIICLCNHGSGEQQHHHAALARSKRHARGSTAWPWLPPLRERKEFGLLLQAEGKQVGVELGVQHGYFSYILLSNWHSCRTLYLVDVWRSQVNYADLANVNNDAQERVFAQAREYLKPFSSKTVFVRNTTLEATTIITEPLDFVYVDARHDYCGVADDIAAYWPKLKSGGIMAGHDYLTNAQAKAATPNQDWSLCQDGSRHESAVKGAVDDFFRAKGIALHITYFGDGPWVSWYVRKP